MKLRELLRENPPIGPYLRGDELFMEGCIDRYQECPISFHSLDHTLFTQQCLNELDTEISPDKAQKLLNLIKSGKQVQANKVVYLGHLGIETMNGIDPSFDILSFPKPPMTLDSCMRFVRKQEAQSIYLSPARSLLFAPPNKKNDWKNHFEDFKRQITSQLDSDEKHWYNLKGIDSTEREEILTKIDLLERCMKEEKWELVDIEIKDIVDRVNHFKNFNFSKDGVKAGGCIVAGAAILVFGGWTLGLFGGGAAAATGSGGTIVSISSASATTTATTTAASTGATALIEMAKAAGWVIGVMGLKKFSNQKDSI